MKLEKPRGLIFDSALLEEAPKAVSEPKPIEAMLARTVGILKNGKSVPNEIAFRLVSQHLASRSGRG